MLISLCLCGVFWNKANDQYVATLLTWYEPNNNDNDDMNLTQLLIYSCCWQENIS